MCPVTIGADRYVLVVSRKKRLAMNAHRINCINILVACLTPLGAPYLFLRSRPNCMGAMTVYTDRSLKVSLEEHIKVDALKGFRVFIEVAPPARF